MPSQNNSGRQFDKQHAVTLVATAVIAANRFIAYDGTYATAAGGAKDSQGVSESAADIGQAVSVVTSYSYLVEASAAITFGAYVKPAADATGRAAVGSLTDCCARALGAAAAAGDLVECELIRHVHA